MKVRLLRTHPEAGNAKSFVFEPETPLTWQAGQFMRYILPAHNQSNEVMKHWFTISSAPHTGTPQITTRLTGSPFKQALDSLKVGDTVETEPPEGDFVWQDSDRPIVFIAGGIGVTPFHSILVDRDHNQLPLNVTLIYANRDGQVVFKDEFDALASKHPEFKVHYVTGQLNAEVIAKEAPNFADCLIYLSGAEPMVEAVGDELKQSMPQEQLKQDFFPGYTAGTF